MYPKLEDIKLFLSNKPGTGANWHELVPAYQRLCVDQLVLEVERLRHLTNKCSGQDISLPLQIRVETKKLKRWKPSNDFILPLI